MSLLSQDQQLDLLPKLAEFLANPWFQHFKQAQQDEINRCFDIILSSEVYPNNLTIREQVIGEARAYRTCADYPETIYNQLVKVKETKV
jgi:hypothetical protein